MDLSAQKLQPSAFSGLPSVLMDAAKIGPMAQILAVDLVEHGDPAARNAWVGQQLFNLMSHARVHSKFWAKRLDRKALANLARAPVLRRHELAEQVAAEGALPLTGPHRRATQQVTSGSTGVASRFFASDMNAEYNGIRGIAQYLFDGRSLEPNRVTLKRANIADGKGYAISSSPHWAGPLGEIFKNGSGRKIDFQHADYAQLGEELSRRPCGYFNSIPSHFVALRHAMGEEKFAALRITEFVSTGQDVTAELRELCAKSGIRVRDLYSCEEVGPIGFECAANPGTYHVATSNVVVESEGPFQEVGGFRVGRLLITHLHSYATPFIRYEIGDLGALAPACACGHRGPVISYLHGRVAALLRHRDGALTSFNIGTKYLEDAMRVREFRVRQTALGRLVVEIVPEGEAPAGAGEAVARLFRSHFGAEFDVDVRMVERIDWGGAYKRMMFRCEI